MKRLVNQLISTVGIAVQRTWTALGSHAAIALGVLVATTTICALILYAEAVNVAVLRDRLARAHEEATYDLLIKGERNLIDAWRYQEMDRLIMEQMRDRVGLPLTRVGRHGWSKSLLIVPPGESPVGQRNQLARTRFQFYADIQEQVEVVEGRFPQPATDPQGIVEVMVTEKLAEELGLVVGDTFTVEDFTGGAQPMHVQARLAAVIRLRDPESNFWFYAPWFLDEALTVPEDTFLQTIALTFVPTEAEVTWAANYDETMIDITNVDRVIAGLQVLRFELTSQLERLQFLTRLDSVLGEYRRSTFMLKALLVVLGAPVMGIALYYIAMSAQLFVEHQCAEIAVLKSRGSSTGQVVALFLAQGLLIVGLATSLAPLLALPLAQLIGKATTFLVFADARLLPVALRPALYGPAGLAATLALGAIMAPTLRASRQTIVTYRREVARESRPSAVHRYYIDLVLLLLGGWGYRTLSKSGSIITRNETGGLEFDPLLLLTPILLAVASSFLALRFVPLLVRGLARITALTEAVAPLFALRQIARTPARYSGLILILTFTLALGLFTAIVADAFDRNYGDQALYAAGADLRTHEFDYDLACWRVRSLDEYRALAGVEDATPARRVRLIGRQAQIRAQGFLLAVDVDSFDDVAWWRADLKPSLGGLLAQLRGDEKAVLADPRFVQRNRLEMGETFDIDIDGMRVDFVLAGTIGYFPTLYPDDGDRLVARLDYLQDLLGVEPSEVWLRTQPRQHRQAVAALRETSQGGLVVVHDGHELAGVRQEDPLRTGLFGALSFGFVAATVLSILGFLLYAYISIQSRSLQFGVLRATGLSVRQLIVALATEQLSLIGVGILLGTTLGGGAGWMFTRFLQLSIIARQAVPPFLVITPWGIIVRLYVILIVIFAAALAVSVHLLRRMRVHAVLRLGEQ
jgi:putative ABC transport system permease protein